MISLRSIIDLTTVFLSSTLSLDKIVTGLVIICVWIAPICPTYLDTINLQAQIHQTYYQNVEVSSFLSLLSLFQGCTSSCR